MNSLVNKPGVITEARQAGANICSDLRTGQLLDSSFDRNTTRLDTRDKRWTHELVYGMLRKRAWLDSLLNERVRNGIASLDPDLIDLLRLGMYQLIYMNSVPAYAAIAQTVELAKHRHGIGASKLVNAVLRRTDRDMAQGDLSQPASNTSDPIDSLALMYSHPRWLVARWVARWGAVETEKLLQSNNTEAPVIIRPYGIVSEQLEATLQAAGVEVQDAPVERTSLQLGTGTHLTELGAFKQGLFFVQDPAATLVTQYADIPKDVMAADLCSAPGGKSLELSRNAQTVFASDKSFDRLQRIVSNIQRLDARNVTLYVADAKHPAIKPVDVVLIDAPCTGTGTFRRHPDARWRLKVSDIAMMSAVQRSILKSAAQIVKPGGLLIYSTCSLEPEENDAQVEAFLTEHEGWILEPPSEEVVPESVVDAGRLRVLPQRHHTDGAFAARLRRLA